MGHQQEVVTVKSNGAYNTDLGKDASTTGTIYGIYDMSGSGGSMGICSDGSIYSGVAYPKSKYYSSYTNTGDGASPVTNYTNDMQHALIETKNWYSDVADFVSSYYPWLMRGCGPGCSSKAGVFHLPPTMVKLPAPPAFVL